VTTGAGPSSRITFDKLVGEAKGKYGSWPSGPRPNQEAVLRVVEEGSDRVAILATGAGKTLCYALPAAAVKATCKMVTLVFTMLRALIVQQVAQLNEKFGAGFAAHSLSSEPSPAKANDETRTKPDRLLSSSTFAETQRTTLVAGLPSSASIGAAITAESPKSKAPLPPDVAHDRTAHPF